VVQSDRFKDEYYLYAVMDAINNPRLYIVQNPAERLKPTEKIEVVRYIVLFNEIRAKGDKEIGQ